MPVMPACVQYPANCARDYVLVKIIFMDWKQEQYISAGLQFLCPLFFP
jgi:hypothetical protein